VSPETIDQSLHVQSRGALEPELTRYLRTTSCGHLSHGERVASFLSGTHEKRRPVACLQRSPRHRSATLSWRFMMHPTVQSFRTPDGVVASALAS
jgi:hypothetical protein